MSIRPEGSRPVVFAEPPARPVWRLRRWGGGGGGDFRTFLETAAFLAEPDGFSAFAALVAESVALGVD